MASTTNGTTPQRSGDTEAALQILVAIAQSIREAGEIPSGHIYAALMGKINLDQYERLLAILKRKGWVEQDRSYLLRWTGPKAQPPKEGESDGR